MLSQVGDGVREEDDFDEALIAELEQREAEHLQAQPQRTVHKWEAYIQHEEASTPEVGCLYSSCSLNLSRLCNWSLPLRTFKLALVQHLDAQ